jgi:hypothetical protein
MLVYGSLEGPENAIYARGRLTGGNVIEMPEYWSALVHGDTVTVQLTAIGKNQKLYVEVVNSNTIIVGCSEMCIEDIDCYYYIMAERKDVERLVVEE